MKQLTTRQHWEKTWSANIGNTGTANLKWLKRYLYRRLTKIFHQELSPGSDKRFFEIGCGSGRWLIFFSKYFKYHITGIDYSSNAIDGVKRILRMVNIDAEIIHEDVFTFINKKSRKYDIVFSDGFIEHFSNVDEIIHLMSTYLCTGGKLISLVPNLTGLHGWLIRFMGKSDAVFSTHNPVSIEDMETAYKNNGFSTTRCYYAGSIIPKVFSINPIISKLLNIILIFLEMFHIKIEGRKISSTYLVIGDK